MPHSSGGGSSHGGSHHSSSHSSSRSSSSGGSSYSSTPSRRVSNSYFRGSRVYVRYVNRRPEYKYCNEGLDRGIGPYITVMIICMFFILNGLLGILTSFKYVGPLSDVGVEGSQPEIYDDKNILGDTTILMAALQDFKNETGIVPTVVAIENKDWQDQGYDIETYAYNWYVYHYEDEKHWVILYSEEVGSNDTFGNWYWEGMQGDYTDSIITSKVADSFTDSLHRDLVAGSRYTKAEAIAKAFNDLHGSLIGMKLDAWTFISSLLKIGVASIILVFQIRAYRKSKKEVAGFKEVKGVKMSENNIPLEDNCDYCGGLYVVGTVLKCPHCDAPIPAHNPAR